MSVADYPNGQAPHSALEVVEDMWVDPEEMAPRVRFIAEFCRARGVSFHGNQGYRWLGVPSDRRVLEADDTSDGTANQWYVRGVEDRGGASSATPGFSNHGKGKSIDCASNGLNWLDVRDEAARLVGMRRDVVGETWHYTIVGPSLVDLTPYRDGYVPEEEKDGLEMLTEDQIESATYRGNKRALQEVVPGALSDDEQPADIIVVFGVNFVSGDPQIGEYGQAAEGNTYLVNRKEGWYMWIVTPGQINYYQDIYGPAQRKDIAFFAGMRNNFSTDFLRAYVKPQSAPAVALPEVKKEVEA